MYCRENLGKALIPLAVPDQSSRRHRGEMEARLALTALQCPETWKSVMHVPIQLAGRQAGGQGQGRQGKPDVLYRYVRACVEGALQIG